MTRSIRRKPLLSTSFLAVRAALVGASVSVAGCGTAVESGESADTPSIEQPLDPAGFSGWSQVPPTGPGTASTPAITSRFPNQRDLFVVTGGAHQISWKQWNPGTDWGPWTTLGGSFVSGSRPAATNWKSLIGEIEITNHLAVVGRSTNNAMMINVFNPTASAQGGWTGWQQISSLTFNSDPAITYHRQGSGTRYLYLVARRPGNELYWTRNAIGSGYNHANWSAWTLVPGGTVTSEPAVVSYEAGLWLVARGDDNHYWEITYNGSWSPWFQIPNGTFKSGAGLASWPGERLHVFGRGMDDHIWQITWDNGWGPGYRQLPMGTFASAPSADSWANGHVDVVARQSSGGNPWINTYQ